MYVCKGVDARLALVSINHVLNSRIKGKLVQVLNIDQIIGGLCHMYTHTQPYTGEGLMALMK